MHRIYIFIVIFYLFFIMNLSPQNIGPVIQGEKRPTSKDPSYHPSILPFYLQQKSQLTPVESYLLNPVQNPDDYLKNQQKRKEKLPIIINPQEEKILTQMEKNPQNIELKLYYIQKYFLPQLGQNDHRNYYLSYIPEPHYEESLWQRRFTIFMLSYPVTTGISYGLYKTYKSTSGLNHQETIGIFSLGILLSFYIIYYDENFYNSIEGYSKYLKKSR